MIEAGKRYAKKGEATRLVVAVDGKTVTYVPGLAAHKRETCALSEMEGWTEKVWT